MTSTKRVTQALKTGAQYSAKRPVPVSQCSSSYHSNAFNAGRTGTPGNRYAINRWVSEKPSEGPWTAEVRFSIAGQPAIMAH